MAWASRVEGHFSFSLAPHHDTRTLTFQNEESVRGGFIFLERSDRLASSGLQLRPYMAPLRARTKLARVHVLDHALTQRADRIRTHGQLLSWMRLKTPRSTRQGATPRYPRALTWLIRTQTSRPYRTAI